MTILAALAVNPGNGSKPYVLIASDSKSVTGNVRFDEEGTMFKEIAEIKEDVKKVHKPLPNLIIGISGTFPDIFDTELINFAKNNIDIKSELNEASNIIYKWIQDVLMPEKYHHVSVEMILGGYLNSVPALSFFGIGHNKTDTEIKYRIAQPGQVFPVLPTLGGDIDDKIRAKLRERIGANSLSNITAVRRALIQFVIDASSHRPDSSNGIVTVERLK